MSTEADEVLKFWFKECSHKDWFKAKLAFDRIIEKRFLDLNRKASSGACNKWSKKPKQCLALIIVLDQFTRNLFRGSPHAFENDKAALNWTKFALEKNYLVHYKPEEIQFCLLPLIHSEDLAHHKLATCIRERVLTKHPRFHALKKAWDDHQVPIKKFGRYPHRNVVLGRTSTTQEMTFLKTPNSSW